jgi:hypothetical protein
VRFDHAVGLRAIARDVVEADALPIPAGERELTEDLG